MTLHNVHEIRQAALAERCRALVRKPRIHAALEDNALDLLYPSAKDELRDITVDGRPVVDLAPPARDFARLSMFRPQEAVITSCGIDGAGRVPLSLMFRRSSLAESALRIASS